MNRLPVFQFIRKFIRILSIISLFFNLIILAIFTQFSPLSWIYTIPGISQIGAFVYDAAPEKAQGFFMWLLLKIKVFLLWIWIGLLDFIKSIIKAVLGEIENNPIHSPEKEPIIEPDKGKYGDIKNPGVRKWLNDYKYYLLGGVVILGIGAMVYIYLDSITCGWRRGGDDTPPAEPFITSYPPFEPEIHGPRPPRAPSVDSDSSGSYSEYFRKNIFDKLNQYKNKVRNYFKSEQPNIPMFVPRGLYKENGKDMYNGLQIPRVETYNGTEFYYGLDGEGPISVLNNLYGESSTITIINPFDGKAISKLDASVA